MAVERAYELVDKIANLRKREFSIHSSRTTTCEL